MEPSVVIHIQYVDRCPTFRSETHKNCSAKFKMCLPGVLVGMEKRGDVATNRINTCEVCPLVSITAVTGECKVRGIVPSSVLSWRNVVNMKSCVWSTYLVKGAILNFSC